MKKPLFILSPCGTSLLNNQASDTERRLVGKCANIKQFEQIPHEDRQKLQSLANRVKEKLMNADIALASSMSAELNSIIKYYGGQLRRQRDYHVLLCTDTWLGESAANLVAECWQPFTLMRLYISLKPRRNSSVFHACRWRWQQRTPCART